VDYCSLSLPAHRIPVVYEQRWVSELPQEGGQAIYGDSSAEEVICAVSRDSASATSHQ
jgi:hypothetical protein